METNLRNRKVTEKDKIPLSPPDESKIRPNKIISNGNTFWLTRILFLRCLAFIYFVAFLIACNQNKDLIGDYGLLPVKNFLSKYTSTLKKEDQTLSSKILNLPTLLWFLEPWDNVDFALDVIAFSGLALSSLIAISGSSNSIALTILWILYHSLVNVGQQFYSFGWESQLLETGFLAIWIVPFVSWKQLPMDHPTPWICSLFYKLLITRIMLGAGMIKMRGDHCWIDLTCMNYFYETQPNPNPVSYFVHQMPEWWHTIETLSNHIVELILPLLALLPLRIAGLINGTCQILFQFVLISTGNFSFLNWLTTLPSIWFFDDKFLAKIFSRKTTEDAQRANQDSLMPTNSGRLGRKLYNGLHLVLALFLAYLSVPVIKNLLSSNQIMNTSYDPLRIVNTYGAFGSVTKQRTEVIFEGTWSDNPRANNTVWIEYEFFCKPGDIKGRPCFISPYHYRLDWQMWFAAFQRYEMNPWMVHLAGKMLQNEPKLDNLIKYNPFKSHPPPNFVRASHYSYTYSKIGSKAADNGRWWNRKYIGPYMQPFSLRTIEPLYDYFGWDDLHKMRS